MSADPLELTLHSGVEVLSEIAQTITANAGKRVALTTMSLEPNEPLAANLLGALHYAADHDSTVHFGVDAFAFLFDSTTSSIGPLLAPMPIGQSAFRQRYAVLDRLNAHGSHVTTNVINRPSRPLQHPFAGRSHIKAAVVGNRCFIIGPNLHLTERTDMAVSFENEAIADRLYGTLTNLIECGSTREAFGGKDRVWQLDPKTQLLIDAGTPRQSLIYDTAIEILDAMQDPDEIIASFQYFPRGRIAQRLTHAVLERGAILRAPYNHPSVQGLLGSVPDWIAKACARRSGMPLTMLGQQLRPTVRNHIKALALINTGVAMVGNHNLDSRGVALGTAELCITRRGDSGFAERVGQHVCDLLHIPRTAPAGVYLAQ